MEIVIKNRERARNDSANTLLSPTAIISIYTPHDEKNEFSENPQIKNVLHLCFDDIEYDFEPGTFMSDEDALKVKYFVEECIATGIEFLWVHCDGGVSRSAGVGAAILKHLTGDDSSILNNPSFAPNMHCYKLVLSALEKKQ